MKTVPHGDETIMIVDDLPDNLRLLQEILQRVKYRVVLFTRGAMALEAASRQPPDLILLDITMPGMDGLEVCRRLKQVPELESIPVLFISALEATSNKVAAFAVGGVDYITKPFHAEEVLARVGVHLALRREQRRSEELLNAMLPAKVVQELRTQGFCKPQLFPEVSILFSDFVGFTDASSVLSPGQIISELNVLYSAFDQIMAQHGCERIKTIGDAYLAASGLPEAHPDHAMAMVSAAREMVGFVARRNVEGGLQWNLRVGIHSGSVIGGIVGSTKYLYDIFGDTVNIASRMEHLSEPGKINISRVTRDLVVDRIPLEKRRVAEVKGKGEMDMYFVATDSAPQ